MTLPTSPAFSRLVLVASLLLAVLPPQSRAQYSVLYSNNFDSYATDIYPFPSRPLPGWTAMSSQSGLQPYIVSPPVNASGNALNMNSIGGGAAGWMSPDSALLAGVTDWTVSGDARYLASYYQPNPWYGVGGIFLSSTGDFSGDYIWLTIQSGWGELNATTTWARPTVEWKLAGTNGGGVLFPWDPPAGATNVVGNAMRMSTDTWGPGIMGLSRTNGSSTLSYNISSPVDGPFSGLLSFSGAQAAALDNLKYIGFANYYSSWQYDNLSASVRAYGLTGGAGDWSDTNNWTGGLVASNGTAVNFSGAGGASTNNNLTSVTGLIFSNGAGSYTVSGNAVTLGAAGIVNNSGNQQTVANDLTLGTSASFTSASGALVVAGNTALGTNTLTFSNAATAAITNSGVVSGGGQVVKTGSGTVTLTASNSYTGSTTVNAGTLRLDSASGGAVGGTASVAVASGATLLLSQSGQVNDSAAVTLSGGTIAKGSGAITETFGALTLANTSFLDFGSGTGSFTFASYSPSTFKLTFQNFNLGNSLTINTGTFSASEFDFNGFGYSWDTVPSGGFTITAIPEPSAVIAACGLLGLLGGAFSRRLRSPRRPIGGRR